MEGGEGILAGRRRGTTSSGGGERTARPWRTERNQAPYHSLFVLKGSSASTSSVVGRQFAAFTLTTQHPLPALRQPFSARNRRLAVRKCSGNLFPAHPLAKRMLNSPAQCRSMRSVGFDDVQRSSVSDHSCRCCLVRAFTVWLAATLGRFRRDPERSLGRRYEFDLYPWERNFTSEILVTA